MGDDFFKYFEKLEALAFFSAFPFLYLLVRVFAANSKLNLVKTWPGLLAYSYALTGILYVGLQVKNLHPSYNIEELFISRTFIKIWAFLVPLFFIKWLAQKPVLAFIHSMVFFFFIIIDLFFKGSDNIHLVRNDMKIFTDSFLLNLACFFFVGLISFFSTVLKKKATR